MTTSLTIPPEASSAAFWTGRLHNGESQLATPEEVCQLNLRIASEAPSIAPPLSLAETIRGDALLEKIRSSTLDLSHTWHDEKGAVLPHKFFPALATLSDLTSIPKVVPIQFGIITRRTSVRTYPTPERVLKEPDQVDLDRIQETIAKPCEPVAIYWSSRGDEWLLLPDLQLCRMDSRGRCSDLRVPRRGAAMVWRCSPRTPIPMITLSSPDGARPRHTAPRAPAHRKWRSIWEHGCRAGRLSAIQPQVDGQTTTGNHVIRFPDRARDGQFVGWLPAIVPACDDARVGPLPLTRANIVRQAFKCLGERYGWGGSYNARDCSSFIADIFACFGIFPATQCRCSG